MKFENHCLRSRFLVLAGVAGLSLVSQASAISYLSATGTFSDLTASKQSFNLTLNGGPSLTEFATWAWEGGTNAAGETIAAGGIDSIIEVFDSSNSSLGWNDDRGTGDRDSLLSPNGSPVPHFTYIPALGSGAYRLDLTNSEFIIGNGSWAADVRRDGTFRLDSTTGNLSTLSSITVGSDQNDGVIVRLGSGLSLSGALNVQSGGVVELTDGVLRTGNASTTGRIDLRDNAMIVDYTTTSPASSIRSQLIAHTIMTSLADSTHALGYADNANLSVATFAGQGVDSTTVLVKFTYLGDANLDGQVDINDLASLATSWQASGVWINGDFDYSGVIDINDLAALATNWQAGVGAPLAMTWEQALASVGLAGVQVPEPATFGLLAMLPLLSRRRRS